MAAPSLNELENEFAQLSPEAQLGLLERLVHQARVALSARHGVWADGLSAMAADPEMQRELSRANTEFRSTEADRLGDD